MDTVDCTSTAAWAALQAHRQAFVPDLRQWFADDPDRAGRWTLEAGDLMVDLSKNLITDPVLADLLDLARQTGVEARRDAMLAGERINRTENRSVLHTALRRPQEDTLPVEGVDVVPAVHAVLERVFAFAHQVRSGAWTGVTGRAIETVVNIGIGGSDLGPAMVYDALQHQAQPGLKARFISNVDPSDLGQQLLDLDPETTLFIVVSKTFTTLETLTNARLARAWLWRGLADQGALADDDQARDQAVSRHFVAVSTALDKVARFGIDPANAFGFWDWVGGRYSVDSAVGTILAVVLGPEAFRQFLDGFHIIDRHFASSPLERNLPVLMGLINLWYRDFLGAATHAVLPYSQYLRRFTAYLQQLTMESNGKRTRLDGSPVQTATGEVFWGEPGTNGQHAFYQLIHQGTELAPADFIALANPIFPLRDGDQDVHELLLANCFAQTKALAFGKTAAEVAAEGTTDPAVLAARIFPGNRPTSTILAPDLTPSVLGQLIALYEHIVFVQGAVWGIDSFDQWGVELGKQLALQIAPALAGDQAALQAQDASTQGLIRRYQSWRRPA
ncbi:MAG: glucose-6-phosphate isomerase [Propionibacteriaceae bacterium]|jgi:glucose-6-phosphate isomerase|nr:glucose-6-phosphate isomerase [Propionibacteriaceae bacterium]